MQIQARLYDVKPGELEDFAREWLERVVPLPERLGFTGHVDVVRTWLTG